MPTKTYQVKSGDCLSSIAFDHGFFPDTLWNHSENASLKQNRKKMNHLEKGDLVKIPEKEEKEESAASEQKHRFRKKGVPAKLKLKILKQDAVDAQTESTQSTTPEAASQVDARYEEPAEPTGMTEEPWRDCPFTLIIDGESFEGFTDGQGFLEISIPPNAQNGNLTMNPNEPDQRIYPLQLGSLGSADEIAGMKRRLSNLGFNCGDQENEMTENFEEVLRLFQETHELDITGELDDATKNKVLELTD